MLSVPVEPPPVWLEICGKKKRSSMIITNRNTPKDTARVVEKLLMSAYLLSLIKYVWVVKDDMMEITSEVLLPDWLAFLIIEPTLKDKAMKIYSRLRTEFIKKITDPHPAVSF